MEQLPLVAAAVCALAAAYDLTGRLMTSALIALAIGNFGMFLHG